MTQETRTVKETAEDAQVKLEREKAMRAQEELQEIYRLEEEARKHKLALWTEKCTNNALAIEKSNRRPESPDSVSNPFVFTFNNVNVNGYVFAIDEVEMLEEFEDDDQIVGKVI